MLNFFKTLKNAWFFSLMISCVDSGSFRFCSFGYPLNHSAEVLPGRRKLKGRRPYLEIFRFRLVNALLTYTAGCLFKAGIWLLQRIPKDSGWNAASFDVCPHTLWVDLLGLPLLVGSLRMLVLPPMEIE